MFMEAVPWIARTATPAAVLIENLFGKLKAFKRLATGPFNTDNFPSKP